MDSADSRCSANRLSLFEAPPPDAPTGPARPRPLTSVPDVPLGRRGAAISDRGLRGVRSTWARAEGDDSLSFLLFPVTLRRLPSFPPPCFPPVDTPAPRLPRGRFEVCSPGSLSPANLGLSAGLAARGADGPGHATRPHAAWGRPGEGQARHAWTEPRVQRDGAGGCVVSQRWAPGPRLGRERRRGSGACGGDAYVLVCGGRPDPGVAGRGQPVPPPTQPSLGLSRVSVLCSFPGTCSRSAGSLPLPDSYRPSDAEPLKKEMRLEPSENRGTKTQLELTCAWWHQGPGTSFGPPPEPRGFPPPHLVLQSCSQFCSHSRSLP
ncbi:hypothetical protein J1605_016060 [Eschrichtius robustus]|uniref:Uncharacterized protein n=1 Tax=Eschrichtius robustus TaxID=9764 RepID=A0AB34G7V6_ESCRO|nr:hypothetical protein J1605_016060 [Eschrichtius robustus]